MGLDVADGGGGSVVLMFLSVRSGQGYDSLTKKRDRGVRILFLDEEEEERDVSRRSGRCRACALLKISWGVL